MGDEGGHQHPQCWHESKVNQSKISILFPKRVNNEQNRSTDDFDLFSCFAKIIVFQGTPQYGFIKNNMIFSVSKHYFSFLKLKRNPNFVQFFLTISQILSTVSYKIILRVLWLVNTKIVPVGCWIVSFWFYLLKYQVLVKPNTRKFDNEEQTCKISVAQISWAK